MVDPVDSEKGTLSPVTRRLIRSYGLIILVAIGFLLLAMLVRSVERTEPVEQSMRPPVVGGLAYGL